MFVCNRVISCQKTRSLWTLLHSCYPWKVLSQTMRLTGCAVLSLPPSPTLFRTASRAGGKEKKVERNLKNWKDKEEVGWQAGWKVDFACKILPWLVNVLKWQKHIPVTMISLWLSICLLLFWSCICVFVCVEQML